MSTPNAFDAKDRQVIGSSRFNGYSPARSEIEIDWTFLARSHWGGTYNDTMKHDDVGPCLSIRRQHALSCRPAKHAFATSRGENQPRAYTMASAISWSIYARSMSRISAPKSSLSALVQKCIDICSLYSRLPMGIHPPLLIIDHINRLLFHRVGFFVSIRKRDCAEP